MKNDLYTEVDKLWWKDLDLDNLNDPHRLVNVSYATLLSHSLSKGKDLGEFVSRIFIKKEFFDDILELLTETFHAKCVTKEFTVMGASITELYFWENGMLLLDRSDGLSISGEKSDILETGKIKGVPEEDDDDDDGNTVATVSIYTMNSQDLTDVLMTIHNNGVPPIPQTHAHPGSAYVMALTMTGIQLIPVGLSGKQLERDNYDDKALISFDRAVRDLNSDSPRGRLTVLEGPPGTGKTHMVRAFLQACPEARFVFIQPSILISLADPGMIPTFIGEMQGPGPIVLVLEDADACLSERKENMNSIQAMLNLSDGVLGSLFDLRILATTNAKLHEFDQALVRPGRLSERIYLDNLSMDQAKVVWERIGVGKKFPFKAKSPSTPDSAKVSLAQIYAVRAEFVEEETVQAETEEMKEKKILN